MLGRRLAVEPFRSATRDGSSLGRDSIVDIGVEQSRELLRDGPRLGEETAIDERGERPHEGNGLALHALLDEGYPALAGRVARVVQELALKRPESSRVTIDRALGCIGRHLRFRRDVHDCRGIRPIGLAGSVSRPVYVAFECRWVLRAAKELPPGHIIDMSARGEACRTSLGTA